MNFMIAIKNSDDENSLIIVKSWNKEIARHEY